MKTFLKFALLNVFCNFYFNEIGAQVQADILKQVPPTLQFYVDIYYSHDFKNQAVPHKLPYLYNHNRYHSFQLNLGFIKLKVVREKYRAAMALQTGTYVDDNYASETEVFKLISEAYAGISLNAKNSLWLDAGIFASHIGFESPISFDNWTLTRSLPAENSPYYLSGLKLNYDITPKIQFTALVCNGWQHIQKPAGNSLFSFGTQLKLSPKEGWIFNWSSFIGTDDPDSLRRMRYFNNFYAQIPCSKTWSCLFGFDLGFQQSGKGQSKLYSWLSPVAILRYRLNDNWSAAFRMEHFRDVYEILVKTNTGKFIISGISFNADYTPFENILCRIEGRWFHGEEAFSESPTKQEKNHFKISASLSVKIF